MWGWIVGGAAKKKMDTKSTIIKAREDLVLTEKGIANYQKQAAEKQAEAQTLIKAGNKAGAKLALLHKHQLEKEIDELQKQANTLLTRVHRLEKAIRNKQMFETNKAVHEAERNTLKGISVEAVEQLQDDMREQQAISDEISHVLAGPDPVEELEDVDLDEELNALQQNMIEEDMLKKAEPPLADQLHHMPVPSTGPLKNAQQPAAMDDDDAELRQLQAEMAL